MLSYNLFPVVSLPAKFNSNTVNRFSLIDQIWSNFYNGSNHSSGVVTLSLTDHFPIFYLFKNNSSKILKSYKTRSFNNYDIEQFINDVSHQSFDSVFENNNPSESFTIFYNILFSIYNKRFPVKKRRIKVKDYEAPWMFEKLKKCIKKKYYLFNLLKRGLICRNRFNVYKKFLRHVINKVKKQYYINKFNNCKDSKQTWKNINKILKRKVKIDNVQNIINNDGNKVANEEVCNYFNDYFVNIVPKLLRDLPNEIDWNYFDSLMVNCQSIVMFSTDFCEIFAVIKSLSDKVNILTNIKPSLLLKIHEFIIPTLVRIFNDCMASGIYPQVLKLARVVPIYKSGCHTDVKNFRPISILNVFNKIFEKIIYTRILSFLNRFKILSQNQFGFTEGRSTTLAIFNFLSDLMVTFNSKKYTVALFLDLRKAFDSVNLDILLAKMERYGIRGRCKELFRSYLYNRAQYVDCNGFYSTTKNTSVGVPQGSVLGPLFFNIFINDIALLTDVNSILFADDAVFYITDKDFNSCIHRLMNFIERLSTWINKNKLIANTEKTKLMLFTPRSQIDLLPDIYFAGGKLEWVQSIKYLGVTIDSKLKFNLHFDEIINKLSMFNGMFYSISNFIPRNNLINIYNSLVLPVVSNNIILWGGLPITKRNKIKSKLNQILRCILKVTFNQDFIPDIHSSQLYKELRILKFDDIYKLNLLKFYHFCSYENFDYFLKYFYHLLPQHQYQTRGIRLNLPNVRLDVEKQFVLFECVSLIIEIDENFLVPQSRCRLVKNFKAKCIDAY